MHQLLPNIRRWLATLLFLPFFVGTLLVFELLLRTSRFISLSRFEHTLEVMNYFILWGLNALAGNTLTVEIHAPIPLDKPVIFISNHQSMFDIPAISWHMRNYTPKYIAKKELTHWVPAVSFALRTMGSLLIDRGDRRQATRLISEWGSDLKRLQSKSPFPAMVIFPEGTRSRNGELLEFHSTGFITLLESNPEACCFPIVIDGSWRILRWRLFPISTGEKMRMAVLSPEPRDERSPRDVLDSIERRIALTLAQWRSAAKV